MKLQSEEPLKKLGYEPLPESSNQPRLQTQTSPPEVEIGSTFATEDGRNGEIVHHHHHYMPFHLVGTPTNPSPESSVNKEDQLPPPKRQRTISGFLASTALDVGLTIGAGALAAASRGVASLSPILVGKESPKVDQMEEGRLGELEPEELESSSLPSSVGGKDQRHYPYTSIPRSNNLDLAFALSCGAATTLLSSLGSAARDLVKESQSSNQVDNSTISTSVSSNTISTSISTSTSLIEEDELSILAINLARALKRSPLPTQLFSVFSDLPHQRVQR